MDTTSSYSSQTERTTELRFSATWGQEPEVELTLVQRLDARDLLLTVRTNNTPTVRFSVTLGQEPKVELALE